MKVALCTAVMGWCLRGSPTKEGLAVGDGGSEGFDWYSATFSRGGASEPSIRL